MKSLLAIALATAALQAGAATALADSAADVREDQERALSQRDQTAVNACANAFVAKIAPGTVTVTHVALPLGSGSPPSLLRPNMRLEVTLEARSVSRGLLADATCEANDQAKVMHLYARVLQPAILAGLPRTELLASLVARL
jgi:hypothetical protein